MAILGRTKLFWLSVNACDGEEIVKTQLYTAGRNHEQTSLQKKKTSIQPMGYLELGKNTHKLRREESWGPLGKDEVSL